MIKQGGMFGKKFLVTFSSINILILTLSSLGFFYWPNKVYSADVSSVQINEVAWMGTLESANNEWLELKNNTDQIIDLTGWSFKFASSSPKILLAGQLEANGYFLLERTDDNSVPSVTADQLYTGALSNAGSDLILSDAQNNLIDQALAVSGWLAGDNLKKLTMERGVDGGWFNSLAIGGSPRVQNSILGYETEAVNTQTVTSTGQIDINNDLVVSSTASTILEQVNIPTNEPISNIITESEKNYSFSSELYLSEILPNPKGDDKAGEFIELYNQGAEVLNLVGWKLKVAGKSFLFTDQAIGARNYLAIYRASSSLTLNNSSSSVELYSPNQTVPQKIVNYGLGKEGQSYALNPTGNWQWTSIITPGSQNIFQAMNHSPKVDWSTESKLNVDETILFDGSDTEDEDDDQLSFLWDFGDKSSSTLANPTHVFNKAGSYKIKLTVSDGQIKAKLEKTLKIVVAPVLLQEKNIASGTQTIIPAAIIINELLPSPEGEDASGEWIELYNKSSEKINLLNWQLDDELGGSKPYIFPEDLWLSAKGFLVMSRSETNLALNNDKDGVRLFDEAGSLVDQVNYVKAKAGLAYAKINNQWIWTKKLTPGRVNILAEDLTMANGRAPKTVKAKTSTKKILGVKISDSVQAVEVSNLAVGQQVRVDGTVIVRPGVLGTQIFYIATPKGLQVYNYRKEFPALALGDYVEVTGEVTESNEEKRLKTSSILDITIIGKKELPQPLALTCDKVDEEYLGQLIKVSGEITKKSGSTLYLDDGTDEALLYIKTTTAIDKKEIMVGDLFEVTGVVNKTKSGLRLLPREQFDLVKLRQPGSEVLGESASSSQLSIPARDKQIEFLEYLLIIAAGVILVLLGVAIKFRKKII